MIFLCNFLFFLATNFCTLSGVEGFVVDTLVRTPAGYACIQDLLVGDEVVAYDGRRYTNNSDALITAHITHITCHNVTDVIQLQVDNHVIQLAHDQLLFDPLHASWMPADQIYQGQYLLCAPLHMVQVQSVATLDQKSCVYSISLNNYHIYRVGSCNLVAHNYAPLGAALCAAPLAEGGGVFAAFLAANPFVAPVTIGVGSVGLAGYGVWKLISGIKESKKACKKNNDKGNKNGLPDGPENNKPPDEITPDGVAAIALLKAIDESKEKAVQVFNKTCEYLVSDAGLSRVMHAFRANCKHNFGPLLSRMGADINSKTDLGKNQVVKVGTKILMDISKKLIDMGSRLPIDAQGLFQNIVVDYGGELITVRGCIHEGIFKIGTMFIQTQHVRKLV